MVRRFALAFAYTLCIATFLLTWRLPELQPGGLRVGSPSVITEVPIARWLLILTPFYWGWVAFHLQPKWARSLGLVGAVILFVACFLFIESQDTGGPFCLWDDGHCGSRWFN